MKRLAEIDAGVFVATSRRYVTTSTVLVHEGTAVVVDPCWDPDELDDLAADVTSLRVDRIVGVATHFHHDHVLWHPAPGPGPRWASPATAAIVDAHRAELIVELGAGWSSALLEVFGRIEPLAAREVPWDGPAIELVVHDAHARGHTALWVADRRLLIAGDMLSDVELPLPDGDDRDVVRYRHGLDALAPLVDEATLLIPGHGNATTNPRERLHADRRYIDDVLAGRSCSDDRIRTPGMADADRATRRLIEGAS